MYEQTTALAKLAATQHGVFTASQAQTCGYSSRQIEVRLARGEWAAVQRGVYRLSSHRLGQHARLMAACLSIEGAVASHESAAWLHRFPHLSRSVPLAVCTGPRGASRSNLARVHRYDGLVADDLTVIDNIPVTSAALTLFHLSAVLPIELLERIIDDRLSARAVDLEDLLALVEYWTRKGRPRRKVMRVILEKRSFGYVPPASELEFEFLQLLRRFQLPEPQRQAPLPWPSTRAGRVDFFFPHHGLVVEVDGRRWHTREKDFESDRERDRAAQLQGLMILRYTWLEVKRRPGVVAAELQAALARAAA